MTRSRDHGAWRRIHLEPFVLSAGAIVVFIWRLEGLLRRGSPSGVDTANFYRVVEGWLGHVELGGVVYPPIVPAVAGLVRYLLGPLWGAHVLQAMAGLAPGLGVWWVCRTFAPWLLAAGAGLAISLAVPTSAAVAWGGTPQLLALGMWPLVAIRAARFPSSPSTGRALCLGGVLSLTLLTSSLIGIASVATVLAAFALRTLDLRTTKWLRHLGWIMVPLLFVVPWYTRILTRMSLPPGRTTEMGPGEMVRGALGEPWALWATLGFLALLGWYSSLRVEGELATLITAINLTAVLGLVSNEARFAYLLPTAMVISACAATLLGRWARPGSRRLARSAGTALALVVLATFMLDAPLRFDREVDFYTRFTPTGTLEAAAWLSDHVQGDEIVLAAPVSGVPTGWWIEAFGVNALVASRDDWLFFDVERRNAAVANRLLSGANWPTAADISELRTCGIRWVFLPDGWRGFDSGELQQAIDRRELNIAFLDGETLVLEVVGDVGRPTECVSTASTSPEVIETGGH